MSAIADYMTETEIDFSYEKTGQVLCRNQKGLIFFLQAEPPAPKLEAKAERPSAPAPTWQPMESTVEVEVIRETQTQPIAEATRRVPEAEARPATAKTGPLPEVPAPGKQPEKGWFGKLFTK